MSEKMPIHIQEGKDKGRVFDPEIAQEMAEVEKEGHEKTLGIIPPSQRKIKKAERAAEIRGKEYAQKKGVEIKDEEVPADILSTMEDYIKGGNFSQLAHDVMERERKDGSASWHLDDYQRRGPMRKRENEDGSIDYIMPLGRIYEHLASTVVLGDKDVKIKSSGALICKTQDGKMITKEYNDNFSLL